LSVNGFFIKKILFKKGGNMEFGTISSGIDFHDLFVVKNHGDKYKQNNLVRVVIS
jgi:hypothetical protein